MRPSVPRATDRQGMTLLELVVALTITGIAVSVGYAAFATALDHRARAEAVLAEDLRAANLRRMLGEWLAGARLTLEEGPGFRGLDGSYGMGPVAEADDMLTILTTAPTPIAAAQVVLSLRIDRDSLTPATGLVADLRPWPSGVGKTVELSAEVHGLDIRYFSIPLGDRGWLGSWVSKSLLPSGIEVTLSGDSLAPLLRLPLLVPVRAGQ